MQVIHGVLVKVAGTGVLIVGESGTGKSALALTLVAAGHQLVADDVIEIVRDGESLTGSPPLRYIGMLNVRGLGILDVRKLYEPDSFTSPSTVDICIELRSGRIDRDTEELVVLGVKLRRLVIGSQDIVDRRVFIETAVRVFRDPTIKCDLEQLATL
jgi:HPr kinase/phosphorylase